LDDVFLSALAAGQTACSGIMRDLWVRPALFDRHVSRVWVTESRRLNFRHNRSHVLLERLSGCSSLTLFLSVIAPHIDTYPVDGNRAQ
jgi:hypothetical protein